MDKKYLNYINVIAMVAVVYLHANGCFWSYSTKSYWFTANIIESIMYFAVPCFFMVSGAKLLEYSKKYSTKVYLIKRIEKTVIPFIAWNIIGIVFNVFIGYISINQLNLHFVVEGIVFSKFISVFWFFIPLFCVYLTAPLVANIDEHMKKEVIWYICMVGFFLNYILPFIKIFLPSLPIHGDLKVNAVNGYMWYFLVGWLLDNIDIKRIHRIIIYILGIVGMLLHMLGTYYLSQKESSINGTFKGYLTVQTMMYSIGIFVFIKQIVPIISKIKLIDNIVEFINKYSFAIYLLHWFVLTVIKIKLDVDTYSLLYRLLVPWIVIVISIFITCVLRKIPLIKKIVP